MLNDVVVVAIAVHVAAFTYVIYGFVRAQFKSPKEDSEIKPKWQ